MAQASGLVVGLHRARGYGCFLVAKRREDEERVDDAGALITTVPVTTDHIGKAPTRAELLADVIDD